MDIETIGYLVGGNLKDALWVRLTVPPSAVQEGAFVVIETEEWLFYGLVTDLALGATDPRFAEEHTEGRLPPLLAQALHGQTLYTNLKVLPALMLERGPAPDSPRYAEWRKAHPHPAGPLPVKTIPSHHAQARLATAGDIAEIFGKPDRDHFVIGYTREQGHPISLDLGKFVQRSSGIFGATGTGKSFLTRIILTGLIQHNQTSLLVLDMHSEYGFDDVASDTKERIIGLKSKFPARVRVVGLGAGTLIRNQPPDFHLELAYADIRTEDIELLSRELNLRETAPTVLAALEKSFGENWLLEFQKMNREEIEEEDERGRVRKVPHPQSVAAWALENGVNIAAAESLHDKLRRIFSRPYLVEHPASDSLGQIMAALEAGQHVFLSFGKYDQDLDYLLVSNVLSRRIREEWERRTDAFRSGKGAEPRPLVIVLEEAHKLLNRELAGQTSFARIAREMRKYYVTLLIIDQRPSQIYDEVMSQLGTRICGWLGDESDITAVLAGLSGREALRGMLARLQPKEEVLLLGWGVPMPLPIRSRRYNEQFWKEVLGEKGKGTVEENLAKLGY
ncbi:MAG: ATP-binding protein [Anaerolineales bacterium]